MDIQIFLIAQQLKTYSQVLSIAREVERGLEKKDKHQMQNMLFGAGKRFCLCRKVSLNQLKDYNKNNIPTTREGGCSDLPFV